MQHVRAPRRWCKRLGSLVLLAAALQAGVAQAKITSLSRLFVLGDSLSDSGNSGVLTGGSFTPPPYVQNRYSNGPVAVEQLWQLFNPGDVTFKPSLSGGTNFAVGGSTSGQENDVGLYSPIFVDLGMASQLTAYAAASPAFDPSTSLFYVSAFPNDVFYFLNSGMSAGTYTGANGTPTTLDDVPVLAAANIRGTVETLIAAGAKHLLVANSPDLSKVPFFLGTPGAPDIARISQDYNTLLATAMAAVASANPQVDIVLYPLDQTINAFIANPASFGFDNVTQACFNNVSVCSDPSRYLFWDAVHPTTRAHGLIAQGYYNSVPGPLPVFGALSALGWSRRLRQRLGATHS